MPNVALGAEGPVERGWGVWLASVIGIILAGIFVIARFLERIRRQGLGLDDYIILVALFFSVWLSITEIEAVIHGYGHHAKTLTHEQLVTGLKWFYSAQIVYKVVLMLGKVSILVMYYRIFQVNRSFRIASHAVNAFIIASNMAIILATIFQCTPVSGFWNKALKPKCIESEPFWISYATINILTDLMLLILPLRQVLRLNISRLEKIGLMLVFGTGCFVTATSIARTTTLAASAKNKDPTWGPLPATVWSVIEANACVVAACLPTLRRPFMVIFGPLFPYAFKNAKTGGSGSGGYQRSDEDPYSGPRSAKSRGSSAPQLSGNTILNSGNRGSYPSKEGGKSGFETYGYAYELDHHSSEGGDDVEREASDSDSGPIVIQHPDNKDSIPPGQAYTIPGPFGRRGSRNETPPQTRGTLGRNGKIYVESDVSVSVSHASTDRLEEREGKGYYSYSGSGLRNGAGRQYSISGGQSRGTSRDRTEQRIPASMGHDNSDPEDRDMGNEYYLRDIV